MEETLGACFMCRKVDAAAGELACQLVLSEWGCARERKIPESGHS